MGLRFTIEPSNYEEDMTLKLPPRALAKFLSRGKAEAVAGKHKNAIVIAADTFVILAGKVIGKPRDPAEAKRMLRLLSGKKHSIITGLTVIDTRSRKVITRSIEANVYFKKLSEREISAYVKTGEPLDKAAAYAVQGRSAVFIKKTEGDFLGIIGLPAYELGQILGELGVPLP